MTLAIHLLPPMHHTQAHWLYCKRKAYPSTVGNYGVLPDVCKKNTDAINKIVKQLVQMDETLANTLR